MKIDIYADSPIISLEYMIAVMQAAKEGESIEYRDGANRSHPSSWEPVPTPKWHWGQCEYRVKPIPSPIQFRPLTQEEAMSFRFAMRDMLNTPISLITSWYSNGIRTDDLFYTFPALLDGKWKVSKDGYIWWTAGVQLPRE